MEECHPWERPKKMGTYGTGPLPLKIRQCYTHLTGVKCVQEQACPCQVATWSCTGSCPLENCRNKGPTRTTPRKGRPRGPNDLRLKINWNQNIKEAHKAAMIICQSTPQVVFYPYIL